MLKIDNDELKILDAYEKGQLESVATSAEMTKLGVAARAKAPKDCRDYLDTASD
ncbi:MAG: hypothetical protein Q8M11_10345 [Sulfuritalea sp.]|nr:hypothetical protein [Sulfuritalea sp.]MDP1983453.1 hypothetical protein [Sulfuritalea sp.]